MATVIIKNTSLYPNRSSMGATVEKCSPWVSSKLIIMDLAGSIFPVFRQSCN